MIWCNDIALPSCHGYIIMTSEPFFWKMKTWAVGSQLSQTRRAPCLVRRYAIKRPCNCHGEIGGSNREVSIVTKAIIMVSFIQEALWVAAQWAARRVVYWWSLSTVVTKSRGVWIVVGTPGISCVWVCPQLPANEWTKTILCLCCCQER